jgi:hypothetical protein
MDNHIYRLTEIIGSSANTIDEAINNAIETASGTLRNMSWFEVTEIRGDIRDGKVSHFQVSLKVGFRYERE